MEENLLSYHKTPSHHCRQHRMNTTVSQNFPVLSQHTCDTYGLHTRKEVHNSDLTGPLFLLPEDNRLRKHEFVSHEWLLFPG